MIKEAVQRLLLQVRFVLLSDLSFQPWLKGGGRVDPRSLFKFQ